MCVHIMMIILDELGKSLVTMNYLLARGLVYTLYEVWHASQHYYVPTSGAV